MTDTYGTTVYDSIAIPESEWPARSSTLFTDGYEYLEPRLGVIYVRKLLQGSPNTESKGWRT